VPDPLLDYAHESMAHPHERVGRLGWILSRRACTSVCSFASTVISWP